jgi:hypothetical protein
MAVNTDPIFIIAPQIWQGQVSAANTARDGTGTVVTIATGNTNGSRLDRVLVTATGTTTAGVVRLFLYNGTNTRLIKELLIPARTAGTGTDVYSVEYVRVDNLPIAELPAAWELRASTHNAEAFNIHAFGGDY